MTTRTRLLPILAMLAVTAVWGWTFVVVRDAVSGYPVVSFLALRFGLAALLLAPVLLRRRSGFRSGLAPGVVLAAGYLCQTLGLQYTTASKAGLLTGLFVVLTPISVFATYRRRPPPLTLVAVPIALLGTALLASPASHSGSNELLGDGLEVCTAILFSVHMILLGRIDRSFNASSVAFSQMAVCALAFVAGAGGSGQFRLPNSSVWLAVVITGALASALAFWIQTYVQQRISPTRTAILLTAEPAFAVLFGFILAGDRFTLVQALGAAFILAALFVHEAIPALRALPAAGS